MNKKILPFLASLTLAFFLGACGDDSSSSSGLGIECLDNEDCLDEEESSSSEEVSSSSVKVKSSSSSAKGKSSASKDKSSSSVEEDESSSSKVKSSSSAKKDESSASKDKSSSSAKKDESSASKDKSSSSAKKDESSSSNGKSSSSVASSSSKQKSSSSVASSSSKPASSSSVVSSSSVPESSSSVQVKITYLSDTPNAADLEVSGDTLFAVFQRSVPGKTVEFPEPGLLAMFKLSDGTLLDTITLVTKNPQAIKMVNGSLYVATQGTYNSAWGTDADENRGIEKIDLKNKKSSLWVSGSALGGGAYMMEVNAKAGKIYAVVNKGLDAEGYTSMPVVEVDIASKSVKSVGAIRDGSGSLYYDTDKKLLYIGDRGFMNWDTYDVGDMALFSYDGTKLVALTDEYSYFQPYSIAVAGGELFVYISDYLNGALYWFEDGDYSDERLQFSADAHIRSINGKIYVLDRSGSGSISQVNPSSKTVAWQKAINAENPYDIVAINSSEAWVAMYNTAEIRKISLSNGSTISSIDTKEMSAKKVEPVE